ncbi:unnamed protein product, partial [Prorocentrum cordatum]
MQRALGKVELQLAHVYLVGLRHSSRPPLRHSDAVRTSQRNEEARGEKTRSTTKKLLLLWTPEMGTEKGVPCPTANVVPNRQLPLLG